ncbi:hypothetical protein [Streptomyces goshikiensis]|uniref:hypothetical protein n=1 Tax=Streptomyces goshikiensis TaxID=1942 RepID=UPI0033300B99
MKPRKTFSAAALLVLTVMVTACGAQENHGETAKQVTMNEQQAIDRAEEIIHQAVDVMSPKPALERTGPEAIGPCIARDDHGPDDRLQVTLFYKLTGVPPSEAKNLVLQARDAWLKQGHKYNSSDEKDMSGPFPWVSMRTEPDDFWMEGITGVLDRAKGEGLATLKVRSPCFLPPGKASAASADPAALRTPQADDSATRRVLGHSSRIYDALSVGSAPTQAGEGLSTVRTEAGASVHHTWSTEPLPQGEAVRAMARAQAHFQSAGWSVRRMPATQESVPALVAGHPEERTVAQIAAGATGAVRVAVTTPVEGPPSADV